ncbi:hypothetical protein MKZ38_001709 [Zalerion maritima]|uniref:WW domain-containing protein n=1 Tax=Zalerion maritima TaxID=339359 RepID=A0AAD5WRA2_9PEZI|nr:hypothetical protein MKZ38_001709 [Zalerion maritima]
MENATAARQLCQRVNRDSLNFYDYFYIANLQNFDLTLLQLPTNSSTTLRANQPGITDNRRPKPAAGNAIAMLKSTYKPSSNAARPLPSGWSEHKAPTGHTYYYNASTKESTYVRPTAAPAPPEAPSSVFPSPPTGPSSHHSVASGPNAIGPQALPFGRGPGSLADPKTANAFMQTYNPSFQAHAAAELARREQERQDRINRPKAQPKDRPMKRVEIPSCEPWILVYTKYGRRFAFNSATGKSYWRIPDKIMKGVLELDVARARGGGEKRNGGGNIGVGGEKDDGDKEVGKKRTREEEEDDDSSEYEEIEVTDSEGEDGGEGEDGEDGGHHASKRRRTEEPGGKGPIEFSEADIAAQLAAMQGDYDMEMNMDGDSQQGYQCDYYDQEGEEAADEPPLSEEDSHHLFHDLLDDFKINPYSSWEKILEDGKILNDPRYVCLPTTKARRESFDNWSRARIQQIKEARKKEEKKDPRLPYLEFLQEKANGKLYWPEFKRKWRKEDVMNETRLGEKEREKLFREYVARLKLTTERKKKDLVGLLKEQSLGKLNRDTDPVNRLPEKVRTDMRYAALAPDVRGPLVEAYVSSLPLPREGANNAGNGEEEEEEESRKRAKERERREDAMRQREEAIREKKRREEMRLNRERMLLREGEREIAEAMKVGRGGLVRQLREDAGKEEGEGEGGEKSRGVE